MVTHCGATLGTQGWGLRLQGGGLMAEGGKNTTGPQAQAWHSRRCPQPLMHGWRQRGWQRDAALLPQTSISSPLCSCPQHTYTKVQAEHRPLLCPPPGPNPMERSVWKGGLHRGSQEMLGLSAHVWLSSAELAWDVLAQEIHSANPVSGD